jgi:LacI family transcriptional regulator
VKKNSKVTLKDLARLAKVSTVTVSNVLNQRPNVSQETRVRVMDAVRRTGYTANLAARGLAGGRTNILGVLVPDLSTQYLGEIVRGVSAEVRSAGMEMLISTALNTKSERTQLELLHNITDGLILILPHADDDEIQSLEQEGVPIVMVDHRGSTIKLPAVDVDNYTGSRQATEYLLGLNHRRIGFIAGLYAASSARLRGYKEALLNASIPFDKTLVVQGNFFQPGGFTAMTKLLALPKPPTAIFAANDLTAFGAMEAIKEHGLRIPNDISVIGFDDIPMASQVYPPLTTVRQPLAEMGAAAVRMMIAKLRGVEPPSKRITLPTELVVRATTRDLLKRSPSSVKTSSLKDSSAQTEEVNTAQQAHPT